MNKKGFIALWSMILVVCFSNGGIIFSASEDYLGGSEESLNAFYDQPLKGDNSFVDAHNEFVELSKKYENEDITSEEFDAQASEIEIESVEEGYTGYKQTRLYNSSSENSQELKLCIRNATKCVKANSLAKKASNTTLQYYNAYTGWQGNGDAFRHVYWNALMTKHIDRDFAYSLGLAHEGLTKGYVYGNQSLDTQMDISNNYSGRKLGISFSSQSDTYIANTVNSNVKKGNYVRIRVYKSGTSCPSKDKLTNSAGGKTCTTYKGKKVVTSSGGALK